MARLDKLIQVMHEQRAEALQLVVGKPASLMHNGALRHLTREPLSDSQIQGLVREIASPEDAARFGSAGPVAFAYRAPTGEVRVELTAGANATASLRPVGPAAAPAASAPASPARASVDLAEARAAMEVLFRLLVESGASDLHLRSGEPPLLRIDGELRRQEQPPIPAERVESMMLEHHAPGKPWSFGKAGT